MRDPLGGDVARPATCTTGRTDRPLASRAVIQPTLISSVSRSAPTPDVPDADAWLLRPPHSPGSPAACTSSMALQLSMENLTTRNGDLCGVATRAFEKLPVASGSTVGGFEVRVTLSELKADPDVWCKVSLSVRSHGRVLVSVSGSAFVHGNNRSIRRACVEALVGSLAATRVESFLEQQVANGTVAGPGSNLPIGAGAGAGSNMPTGQAVGIP